MNTDVICSSCQVPVDKVALIEEFEKYYNPTHMKGSYRKGVMAILKVIDCW